MKSYTVKEIAETLKTNPETVRRWIRSGKLSSTMTSTKAGNIVTEDALNKFIKETPKYAAMLVGSVVTSPVALSLVVGGLIGAAVGGAAFGLINNPNKPINKNAKGKIHSFVSPYLKTFISESTEKYKPIVKAKE